MVQLAVLFLYLCTEQCHRVLYGSVVEISPMHTEYFYTNPKVTNL
jgi:hypothetical protein